MEFSALYVFHSSNDACLLPLRSDMWDQDRAKATYRLQASEMKEFPETANGTDDGLQGFASENAEGNIRIMRVGSRFCL